jgi:aspartate 1-decarboxylase
MRIGVIVLMGLALSAGCAQKRSQPIARTATPPVASAVPAAVDPAVEQPAAEREKRPRRGEAAVYIDGKSVGVLRKQELPSKLTGKLVPIGEGYEAYRYGLMDYAASLGIDTKKLRAAHLYGGSRVALVDRAELTRIGADIQLSFTMGDRGKPRVHFPPKKLNINTTVDMLSGIAFYVDKEPPTLKDNELVMPDGTSAAGKVPYAPEEQGNGTRVYCDGALVGTVKRKKLTNDLAVPGDENNAGPTKFSLVAYAGKLGVDAKRAKAIDLVAGDDVVAHLGADGAKNVTFSVPSRNRGQALIDLPASGAAGSHLARISAIQIFVKTTPPVRSVVALDDASEATPSAAVGRGADDDQ